MSVTKDSDILQLVTTKQKKIHLYDQSPVEIWLNPLLHILHILDMSKKVAAVIFVEIVSMRCSFARVIA